MDRYCRSSTATCLPAAPHRAIACSAAHTCLLPQMPAYAFRRRTPLCRSLTSHHLRFWIWFCYAFATAAAWFLLGSAARTPPPFDRTYTFLLSAAFARVCRFLTCCSARRLSSAACLPLNAYRRTYFSAVTVLPAVLPVTRAAAAYACRHQFSPFYTFACWVHVRFCSLTFIFCRYIPTQVLVPLLTCSVGRGFCCRSAFCLLPRYLACCVYRLPDYFCLRDYCVSLLHCRILPAFWFVLLPFTAPP